MTDSPAEAVGRRIGAGLIDLLVIFVLLVVVGMLFGQGYASHGHAGVMLHGPSVVVWAIVCLGYYFVLELLIGQTLGKRLLRVHVVSRDGGKPSAAAIAVRTLLRIVDFLPFFYLVGLLSVLFSGARAQRLGDLAAGTTVAASPAIEREAVPAP